MIYLRQELGSLMTFQTEETSSRDTNLELISLLLLYLFVAGLYNLLQFSVAIVRKIQETIAKWNKSKNKSSKLKKVKRSRYICLRFDTQVQRAQGGHSVPALYPTKNNHQGTRENDVARSKDLFFYYFIFV